VTKFNATVDDVTRLPDMLRQAFRVATTGFPGPVHLQMQGNEGQLDTQTGLLDTIVETEFAAVPRSGRVRTTTRCARTWPCSRGPAGRC
jgi:acetolactate synthase-1/2/3 large subunit